jgi:flagellar biosynthesis regulator FlbT
MSKNGPSSASPRSVEPTSAQDLTLEQARAIVASMTYYSDDVIIAACTVIEKEGGASEKFDFQALRKVFEVKTE